MDAQQTVVQVWCVYPIGGIYTLPWRLLMWAAFLAVVLRTLSSITDWVYSISTSFFILCLILSSSMGLFTSFFPDADHDANAVVLPVILLTAIYAMIAVLIFSRRFFEHPWVPQTIHGVILGCMVFCMLISNLSSRVLSHAPYLLTSVDCGGNSLCENPCAGIQKATYRGGSDYMQAAVWSPSDRSILDKIMSEKDWLKTATQLDRDGYNFLLSLRFWYWMLGPILYTASLATTIRPRKGRDIVFQNLQESLRLRAMNDLSLRSHLDWVEVKLRNVLLALKISFPLIQVLEALILSVMYCIGRKSRRNSPPKYIVTMHETLWRYYIGKGLGVLWYVWALLFECLFPILAVYLIVKSELSFRWIPNLEDQQPLALEVPWLYMMFIVLVAIIPWAYRKWKHSGVSRHYLSNKAAENGSADTDDLFYMRTELSRSSLPIHHYIAACVIYEWRDFVDWWKDPRKTSRQQSGTWAQELQSKDISDWAVPIEDVVPSSAEPRTLHRQDMQRSDG